MAIISISDSQVNGADQILVADGSSKIPAKDGSQITILNATNVSSGTIATARLDTGTTAGKLVVLDGSGNLPVVDGSLLTGIVSATISASDPTISTNPSGGLGTEWLNSTSGEMYICTDATAGANVWVNVGAGSDNIQPHIFQGTNYGYKYGSYPPAANRSFGYDQVSLTTDGNGVDVGDITQSRDTWCGMSSATHGYCMGGYNNSGSYNIIDKHPFATNGNLTDVGDLSAVRRQMSSSSSAAYGYCTGGGADPGNAYYNIIERVSFSADGNMVDVGDLTTSRKVSGGHSDPGNSYGYHAGGYDGANTSDVDRYQQQASASGADVGDLVLLRAGMASASSLTHGYGLGFGETNINNHIEKYTMAASITVTDVGNLTQARFVGAGVSSTTYGYILGGMYPHGGIAVNNIEKVSFSSDGNGTDVGDLTEISGYQGTCGSQY